MEPLDYVILVVVALAAAAAGFIAGVRRSGARPRGAKGSQNGGSVRRKPRDGGLVEIYVGNLAYDVSEKDLSREFEKYGRVAGVRIIENRFNGKSKGYGFVEMADEAESEAAIKALHGKEFKGRKLVVNEARSKSRE